MSGDVMFGRCECCGKEKPLQRTYFRYPINCQCHNNQHFELIDHCADCMPQKPKETKVCLSVQQIDEIAALREENDLQRHSIQQLSAQVAGLREGLKWLRSISYTHEDDLNPWPSKETRDYIDGLITSPNPGAEIMERMKKLEAVAEAARDYREHEYLASTDKWHEVIDRLDKSLDALEAVTPCP